MAPTTCLPCYPGQNTQCSLVRTPYSLMPSHRILGYIRSPTYFPNLSFPLCHCLNCQRLLSPSWFLSLSTYLDFIPPENSFLIHNPHNLSSALSPKFKGIIIPFQGFLKLTVEILALTTKTAWWNCFKDTDHGTIQTWTWIVSPSFIIFATISKSVKLSDPLFLDL